MMPLPKEFLKLLESYATPALQGLGDALCGDADVSVRANVGKGYVPAPGFEPVRWNRNGIYLPFRPKFTFDPQWHQGAYYVQDASSMFISAVIRQMCGDRPIRLLEACAAPGGKTTAAMDMLPTGSTVVANEFVAARETVLRENLAKWGFPAVRVTGGDTSRFRSHRNEFDVVLADVPCSGEGMMRKDAVAVQQWSMSLVKECVARQKEIISNIWPSLKPGGILVYSTCTFNRMENEEMVEHILREYESESVEVNVDKAWGIEQGIDTDAYCYRFIPGKIRGEGLFVSVIRKLGDLSESNDRSGKKIKKYSKKKESVRNVKIPDGIKEWVIEVDGEWCVDGDKTFVRFGEGELAPELPVAVLKGRDWLPTQHLCMNRLFRRGMWQECEVSAQQAVEFLSCNSLVLDGSMACGIVLLTYGGEPLGWVKNLGNRANNLYPKQWRIVTPNATAELPGLVERK